MLLHLVHETRYAYSPTVESAHHVLHLKPASHAGQQLLSHQLTISPQPAQMHELPDVYGNTRTFFSLHTPHEELTVVAESVVSTLAVPEASHALAGLAWEQVREQFRYQAGGAYDSACEFVFASPYVPRDEAFAEFARPSFSPGRPLPEAAQHLMARIHSEMAYDSDSTDVGTPALDALQLRKGVCQDFAHIMVACCRSMGVPARYVSGYLLTNPPPGQPRLIGSDASHAWASVYCPLASDAGGMRLAIGQNAGVWLDFDPTNNRAPGEDYVTLATGRDFLDVSPMRGVIRGGARHVLDVAVTVTPLPEPG
ncbi:transglutaminase family protein [Polaromonas eurypsychrophila]|uniref:Transglutaminase n=1 Tax=Polaromonas eurypsychrophila TaxID=1614635 RepID=A0A916SR68_9BURK|nr:transglutaminase family protein [Polaromonas eurypsychrophila]GGB12252.1 transglutaminase [Polaromonas eurypsychrophila]